MGSRVGSDLDALSEAVIGACYEVSNTLGAGFLEKVYERALAAELVLRSIPCEQQKTLPVTYKGALVGDYAVDLLVDNRLVVELKCVEAFRDEHVAQCLNYLKAAGLRLALLVNFQKPRVQIKRVVLD